jgi:hypothetical protein
MISLLCYLFFIMVGAWLLLTLLPAPVLAGFFIFMIVFVCLFPFLRFGFYFMSMLKERKAKN